MGMHLIKQGKKVAVLAIDPSSSVSHGSILGDKTRMEHLATQANAFIRPTPSGSALGGVARKTRETIFLVEAAGYDVVLIETVGVGQSEIAVHSMTDVFLLLLLPGAGDELQGIKRGIVEMADFFLVNKADGDRATLAALAQTQYRNALHLFPEKPSKWIPEVMCCSAETGVGIAAVWEQMEAYAQLTQKNGYFFENRRKQAYYWFKEALQSQLFDKFYSDGKVQEYILNCTPDILNGKISPFAAADQALKVWDKS
ncbi:MAG: methylmalonyl Co-A mutase-associated GTPase MeaB, partial [Bacteroidetes bacterium]|nr:methylmalonyl Co-A mutase-associated GTPase MeaB [Bacteroidota bacterium]